jgi:hypothetical protein
MLCATIASSSTGRGQRSINDSSSPANARPLIDV